MKKLLQQLLLILILLLTSPLLSRAETIRVKVVGIVDGDTITVLTKEKTQKTVLIKGIDAPEKAQDFGFEARQRLTHLILNKNVVVEYTKIRPDGEILGKVFLNGKDIGLELLETGFAWYDGEQNELLDLKADSVYDSAEIESRRQSIGLWQNQAAQEPWEFRKNYKPKDEVRGPNINDSTVFEGQVMEVVDGASIALKMSNNSRIVICVSRLETPEPGQPRADIAEQHLRDLLLQKNVRVSLIGLAEDRGCLTGDVYLNNININLQMVRDGVAWANKNYAYPEGYYAFEQAEQAARSEQRGIWQDSSPTAPWEYRAQIYRTMGSDGLSYRSGSNSGGSSYNSSAGGTVRVRGYYRSNGTYVNSYTRSAPGRGASRSSSSSRGRH